MAINCARAHPRGVTAGRHADTRPFPSTGGQREHRRSVCADADDPGGHCLRARARTSCCPSNAGAAPAFRWERTSAVRAPSCGSESSCYRTATSANFGNCFPAFVGPNTQSRIGREAARQQFSSRSWPTRRECTHACPHSHWTCQSGRATAATRTSPRKKERKRAGPMGILIWSRKRNLAATIPS